MLDLAPWQPVSMMPPVCRDLSILADASDDEEILGDRARTALAAEADVLESLSIRAVTHHEQLPTHVRERVATRAGQVNILLRLVLRPVDRTLTDTEAHRLRDRVYAALHCRTVMEWATPTPPADQDQSQPDRATGVQMGIPY